MIKIILVGACGKMGTNLSELVNKNPNFSIVAGIDKIKTHNLYPIYNDFSEIDIAADVIIDFSKPDTVFPMLSHAIKTKTPVVIAQTGLTKEHDEKISQAASAIPVFYSANLAFNVLQFASIVSNAAKLLYPEFEIEIVEKHHSEKRDAPSGTALMIFNQLQNEINELTPNLKRNLHSGPKQLNEVGIHAIRGGNIVGEHQVLFIGQDESISFTHAATSKRVFSKGALEASLFIIKQKPGLYRANDLLEGRKIK